MSEPLVAVELVGVPLRIQRDATEHFDALVREFDLIRRSEEAAGLLPVRLLDLIDELTTRYSSFTEQQRTTLQAALEREDDGHIDLRYELPADVAEASEALLALLEEADEYCLAGEHLITLAAPPRVRAYRRWVLGEFAAQARGRPPRPWNEPMPESAGPADTADLVAGSGEPWVTTAEADHATVVLSGELDLAVAPSLRDHLNGLHAAGVRHFVLDAGAVSFIDSVGLSVMLAVYRRCRDDGGSITLRRPSDVVLRTLEISGLVGVLDVA